MYCDYYDPRQGRSQGYEHVYAQRQGVRIYRAFPKRGGSGFSLIHGCYFMGGGGGETPIPAARSPADTVGGPGGLPRGKLEKKDRKWWHLMVFAVKILIYKF